MRFLSVRPEVCPWVSRFPTSGFLQIPPHDGHPCLRLYPSRYRADSGLSPVRNVRRQAHREKSRKLQVPLPGVCSFRPFYCVFLFPLFIFAFCFRYLFPLFTLSFRFLFQVLPCYFCLFISFYLLFAFSIWMFLPLIRASFMA